MMENPFFRNYWNSSRPRYSPSTRGVPVCQQETKPRFQSPKIVSIPVHFVESENTRSIAALRIQKVFRGFLVRKNVKKIVSIKTEVEEIERRISKRETVELVRKDAKERLRMNEMLMALLLRLDSVRGVDSGVRDCRKAVIRKAIALQEKLDAIVVAGDQSLEKLDVEETTDQGTEEVDPVDPSCNCESGEETGCQAFDIIKEIADRSDNCETADNLVDQNPESADSERNSGDCGSVVEAPDQIPALQAESSIDECNATEKKFEEEGSVTVRTILKDETEPSSIEGNEESENLEASPEKCEGSIEKNAEETLKKKEDGMDIEQPQPLEGSESNENTVLMERMLKENAKLMGLVTQLCERNALQTEMISSLSHRVENLEKAFTSEKLKQKKKKKRQAVGIVERHNTPDPRKCGRKL